MSTWILNHLETSYNNYEIVFCSSTSFEQVLAYMNYYVYYHYDELHASLCCGGLLQEELYHLSTFHFANRQKCYTLFYV